jgi:hypothetical protein
MQAKMSQTSECLYYMYYMYSCNLLISAFREDILVSIDIWLPMFLMPTSSREIWIKVIYVFICCHTCIYATFADDTAVLAIDPNTVAASQKL